MPKKDWLSENTYHHSTFRDLGKLVEAKRSRNLKVSLCFPTLNEEATIAKEIVLIGSELQKRFPLIDEIVVIDSGSKDRTREIAAEYGAKVFLAEEILPDQPQFRGKGENLWKALHVLEGDVIVYIDADIKNIHPRFAYGLLGPLLIRPEIQFVKAFYERPIALGQKGIKQSGGGRVTELVIRPLFSLFYPDLAQIIQPLSGEYAGTREVFESIAFPIGYGVETSMLIDIFARWGMDVVAQVDLDRRVHRNQSTLALGRMAFGIMETFFRRLQTAGRVKFDAEMFRAMIQFEMEEGTYHRNVYPIEMVERPPIISLPEYALRHKAREEGKA